MNAKKDENSPIEILFNIGESLFPDEARRATAKLLDKINQPSLFAALFNRHQKDEKRTPLPTVSPIAFGSYSKGFSIIAINENGREILRSALPYIVEAWRNRTQKPVFIKALTHATSLRVTPFYMRYTVKKIVLGRRKAHTAIIDPSTPDEIKEKLIASRIRKTLLDYSETVGLDIEKKESIEVRVISYEDIFVFKKKGHDGKGKPVHSHGFKNLSFEINADLSGLWMLGYHRSSGFGHFRTNLIRKNKLDKKLEADLSSYEALDNNV